MFLIECAWVKIFRSGIVLLFYFSQFELAFLLYFVRILRKVFLAPYIVPASIIWFGDESHQNSQQLLRAYGLVKARIFAENHTYPLGKNHVSQRVFLTEYSYISKIQKVFFKVYGLSEKNQSICFSNIHILG